MKAILEGLIFISGDEGLTLEEINKVLNININELKEIIKELYNDYNKPDKGIKLEFLGKHFKFTTKKEHKEYYEKLIKNDRKNNLSDAALEVLSIIAYKEPISRIDIDNIRGVNSSYLVRKLLLNELIEEKGKSDAPGKPTIYGVTSKFLDYFGLGSTKELPELKTNEKKDEETDLFNSKYTEKN